MLENIIQKFKMDRQAAIHRLLLLFAVALFLAASHLLSSLLKPFILALFIAYGLKPIVDKLEKKGVNSILAIVITLTSILILLTVLVYFLYATVSSFLQSGSIDVYIERFNHLYDMAEQQAAAWGLLDPHQSLGKDVLQRALAEGKSYIMQAFTQTTNFLSQAFLFVFYLVLLLPGIKNFRIKVNRAFERRMAMKVNLINDKILAQIQQYITQKTLISLGEAVLVSIFCFAFHIDLALVWGVLTFLLNYIPNIGSLVASFFPILVAWLQPSTSATAAAALSLLIVAVQLVGGNLIEPKLFSNKFSLSTLVVFGGLVFWGWLWGMVGVILSVPIMVIISILCQNIPAARPVGIFLKGSFPVREDEERLSLMVHVAYADRVLQDEERRHIEAELQKEIYNPDSIKKVWKKIERQPLPLEKIFEEKAAAEKLDRYKLACKIALLDNNVCNEEQRCLEQIQKLAQLAPTAVANIHRMVCLEKGIDDAGVFTVLDELSDEAKEEQIAHSYKMLGHAYFVLNQLDQARENYVQALRMFILMDDSHEMLACLGILSLVQTLCASAYPCAPPRTT